MPHAFTFFRTGGFDQVALTTAADIAALPSLDQKLWAALSCPVKGLEFDERTLALIDTDGDGRVRVGEMLAAIAFAKARLKDLGAILAGSPRLPLSAIADGDAEGKAFLACAKRVLAKAGMAEAKDIGVEDIASAASDLIKTDLNGDGIVPPAALADPAHAAVATDIIAITGGDKDRTGIAGIGDAALAAFIAELGAYAAWRASGAGDSAIWPVGEAGTATAAEAVAAVAAKVDDYFARCRLAAYDARAEAALNRREEDFLTLAAHDLTVEDKEIAGFPIARIGAGKPLPLAEGINPAWSERIAVLRSAAVAPLLGDRTTLDEAGWKALRAKLAPYAAWRAAKAGTRAEALGEARVRALLAARAAWEPAIAAAIAADRAVAPEFDSIAGVEKLVRLHRDLYRLLHNFVNFADFYSPHHLAVFQAGTLYLDNRSFELCVRVDDAGKHAALAGLAKTYLAYCDCTRKGSAEKRTICVAVTNGDSDFLMVGRNGVFYDRQGQDWDATITKVIESPISIREAFWAPYKKAVRFVEELIAKRAAAADDAATAKLQTAAATAATAAETGKKPEAKPKFEVGTIAALGVGLGAIGGILGGFVSGFIGLKWWMPLGIVGIILAISLPSCIIAALKLRLRNLGPILDANGWAVNGRVKINIPFGASLSALATLPAGSSRSLTDPYAPKRKPWKRYVLLALILAAAAGLGLDRLRSTLWAWDTAPGREHPRMLEWIMPSSATAPVPAG